MLKEANVTLLMKDVHIYVDINNFQMPKNL